MDKKQTTQSRINPGTTKAMGVLPQKLPEDISENEQRYRELVEHLPLGIAILLDGKLVFLNISGAIMMAGEKPEDLVGRDFMDFVHPDYQDVVRSRVLRIQ